MTQGDPMAETPTGEPDRAPEAEPHGLAAVAAQIATTAAKATQSAASDTPATATELLDALVMLRWARHELIGIEPTLIAAARAAGVSWQELAPALGVASRQAAERRYLRSTSAPTDQPGATRDERVQAERDRRARHRAVSRWANSNTADLRRLSGQITALTDLDAAAGDALARLHTALGDPDASALPALLAAIQRHLHQHPGLSAQINTITAHTDQIRMQHPSRGTEATEIDTGR
jgi:hypothetical protein